MTNNWPALALSAMLFALASIYGLTINMPGSTVMPGKGIIHNGNNAKAPLFSESSDYLFGLQAFNGYFVPRHGSRSAPPPDTTYTLPVVFHIIGNSPYTIPDQQILNGLQDLNDAFGKTGAYTASKGVDTKIRFCVAHKDPDGGITTGITRTTYFFGDDLNPDIEDDRLKNLIQWDPSRYINIWYIPNMHEQEFETFGCGQWQRVSIGGYATPPPNAGPLDGIVVTSFGVLLANTMGTYLGLLATYTGGCTNNNCHTDGDQVCDTPPEYQPGSTAPDCVHLPNTCSTDTLSGFKTDVPDQKANFMDFGIIACQNEFTEGQAERMDSFITNQRSGLLANECNAPCTGSFTAAFTRDNAYPLPGDNVTFTNASSGASSYQWLVNGTVVSTAANFSYTFPAAGKYKVTLKAFNADPSCFAAYTDYVIVTCGVTARFYTNKKTIASKYPLYLDSIAFTNTSVNATSYRWLMANDQGMAEQVVTTQKNFTYIFKTPANYTVRLIATNGGCTDTTELFHITVFDPTQDGAMYLTSVSCYHQTQLLVGFFVCNYGYATIPPGIPTSFYDADPRAGNAHKLATFILPDSIQGSCCGNSYTQIINVGARGLNQLYAVFNDSGTTMPLHLPNTPLLELNYDNNIQVKSGFQYSVTAVPDSSILQPGDTLKLSAVAKPDYTDSFLWTPPLNLSCTICDSPFLIADSNRVKQVVAISQYGCTDTAQVIIKVPPANDYTVVLNDIECAGTDSLYVNFTLTNHFKRGIIPQGLTTAFYNSDPTLASTVLLPPLFAVSDSVKLKSATFSTFVAGAPAGNIYAVVNDSGTTTPLQLPNVIHLPESNYANNQTNLYYQPQQVQLQPADTTVLRKTSFQYAILTPVINPASTAWAQGEGYTLNCYNCGAPTATVFDSATVTMQTANQFGCLITGTAMVKILPPDMTVKIINSQCYTNDTVLVFFTVCMNNNYDSVFANLPVAFYDGDPTNGGAQLLQPVFYTKQAIAGNCDTFFCTIAKPATNKIYASVNDNGRQTATYRVYDETDFTNNIADTAYTPFTMAIVPADTSIMYGTGILLRLSANGGSVTNAAWWPYQFLSCANCLAPVATPDYSLSYQAEARNQYFCIDTAYTVVKTYRGPADVSIPSAFTPNGDGVNDVFYILGAKDAALIKNFAVYNRWGNAVFHVSNVVPNTPVYGWDGNVNGVRAQSGTYVYEVTMQFADGSQKSYKGTVVLIR